MRKLILLSMILLSVGFVLADDYIYTGATDFNVYIDSKPYLDGTMYATVAMSDQLIYKCISMIFINESGGAFTHVQSNPTLASSSGISLRVGKTTPEEDGYFTVTNGLGTVYWRKFNQVAGADFLYVVKCNTDNSSLTWESFETPTYREVAKTVPGRAMWVVNQGSMWGWVFFILVAIIIIVLITARLIGRK